MCNLIVSEPVCVREMAFSGGHSLSLCRSSSQTIVRGSKIAADGSLSWLLDEFETMSVTRSNSLRRGSPPVQPRRDSAPALGVQENGEPPHRPHPHAHPDRHRDSRERYVPVHSPYLTTLVSLVY